MENLYKMGFGDSCSLFCLIDLHGPETKSLLSCIAVGSIHDWAWSNILLWAWHHRVSLENTINEFSTLMSINLKANWWGDEMGNFPG